MPYTWIFLSVWRIDAFSPTKPTKRQNIKNIPGTYPKNPQPPVYDLQIQTHICKNWGTPDVCSWQVCWNFLERYLQGFIGASKVGRHSPRCGGKFGKSPEDRTSPQNSVVFAGSFEDEVMSRTVVTR